MVLTAVDDMYIKKGVKVLVNPSQEYFDQLQEWISETERWNYRNGEYKLWQKTFDKFWMYLAIDEETDEVISSVSLALQTTLSGEPLYSIGNYYCVPDWRGKGISNKLFNMAMKVIGENNATLYGATLMSDLYAKRHNFSLMNSFWHSFAEIDGCDLVIPKQPSGYFTKKIEENDWEKIHEYDETICELDRRTFMKTNLSMSGTVSRIVSNESGKIVGFAAMKYVTGNEIMLSPMYADNFDAAVSLISSLLTAIPNLESFSSLVTIYPDANNDVPRLLSLISNNNFDSHPGYKNQYTKRMLKFPQHKIFANDECSHCPV